MAPDESRDLVQAAKDAVRVLREIQFALEKQNILSSGGRCAGPECADNHPATSPAPPEQPWIKGPPKSPGLYDLRFRGRNPGDDYRIERMQVDYIDREFVQNISYSLGLAGLDSHRRVDVEAETESRRGEHEKEFGFDADKSAAIAKENADLRQLLSRFYDGLLGKGPEPKSICSCWRCTLLRDAKPILDAAPAHKD